MNKHNFENQFDVVNDSEVRSLIPATDFSRTMQPLQELTLSEITAVGGGLATLWL